MRWLSLGREKPALGQKPGRRGAWTLGKPTASWLSPAATPCLRHAPPPTVLPLFSACPNPTLRVYYEPSIAPETSRSVTHIILTIASNINPALSLIYR